MKTCPNCGKPVRDDELFCASCGVKCAQTAPPPGGRSAGFCPNCGERLPVGTQFCPNCGVRAGQTATGGAGANGGRKPPVQGRSSAKLAGIIAGCVGGAAVLALVIFLVSGLFASPAKKFVDYQKKLLLDQAFKSLAAAAEQANARTSLSTDLTLTARCGDSTTDGILRDSAVDLKVDAGKNSLLLNGELTLMGSPVLSGALTYDKGRVGFCLPEADESYYVADLAALGETLGVDGLDSLSSAELPQIPVATLTRLANTYLDIVTSAVTEDNVEKSQRDEFRLDELHTSLQGDAYVFTPSAEDIEEMLLKLADQLEKDEDLRGLATDFLGDSVQTLAVEGTDFEAEIDSALNDLAEQIRDGARDAGRELEDAGFTWTVGVSKGEVCLERIEVNDGAAVAAYEAAGGQTTVYSYTDGSLDFKVLAEYEKDGGVYRGAVSVTDGYGYGEVIKLGFEDVEPDRQSVLGVPYGSYVLRARDQFSAAIELEAEVGPSDGGGTDHVISVPEAYAGDLGGLKLTIRTTDKKSTAAKPKGAEVDISGYSADELGELAYSLGSSLESLINQIGASSLF